MKANHPILMAIVVIMLLINCKTPTEILQDFSEIRQNTEAPLVLMLENDLEYAESTQQHNQLLLALDYSKVSAKKISVSAFNSSGKIIPSVKVICAKETLSYTDKAVDSLHAFVARGGTLVLTKANFDERLAFLMGLSPAYTMKVDQIAEGIAVKDSMFLGKKLTKNLDEKHLGLHHSNFSNNVTFLATALNNGEYPVVLLHKVGKGKVVMYNSNISFEKATRGFAFSLLLLGLDGIPYPVANVGNIHLEGSLLGNSGAITPGLASSLVPSKTKDFVRDVWWPDMKKLANKHKIYYTISPSIPSAFNTKILDDWWGVEALREGHELGFLGASDNGNNVHQASNPKNVKEYFERGAKFWDNLDLGLKPSVYFSRNSSMDGIGLKSLKQWLPSIKYVHGRFYKDHSGVGGQEYEPNRMDPYFFNVPVIPRDYIFDSNMEWDGHTQFLVTGIWNQALTPDELGDKNSSDSSLHSWRSMKNEIGLYETFNAQIGELKNSYPMLRFMSGTRASETIVKWRYAYYRHIKEEGLHVVSSNDYVNDLGFEDYWHCYVSGVNDHLFQNDLKGVVKEYHKTLLFDGFFYQIKTEGAFISLSDLNAEKTGDEESVKALVFRERSRFKSAKFELLPFLKKLEFFRNQGQYSKATELIENHIIMGNDLPMAQWMDYANMMHMQSNEEQLWNFLERQYTLSPSEQMVFIGLGTKERFGWPNEQIAENWLAKAIEWNLGGLSVLREYGQEHHNLDNRIRTKKVLKKIWDITKKDEDRIQYIKFLMASKDPQADEELNQLEVCEGSAKTIASQIAKHYAESFAYDKAYQWSFCASGIDVNTVNGWMENSQGLDNLKTKKPLAYYGILLNNQEERAYKELKYVAICSQQLRPLAGKIAQLFGNMKDYRGALSWAKCSEGIDIKNLLTWNSEMQNYTTAKSLYWDHMGNNKNAHDVSEFMANICLEMGDLSETCKILSTLPPGNSLNQLKELLNANLKYAPLADKQGLIADYPSLFDEETKNTVTEESRMAVGNDVFFRSTSTSNQFDFTQLTFLGGYALKDRGGNVHEIAAVRGFVYEIEDIQNQTDNLERNLLGLNYSFMKPMRNDASLTLGARLEGDNANKTFFHLNAMLQKTNEKGTLSAQLQYRPVPTGPGYVRDIYQGSFKGVAALNTDFGLNPSIQLQGRYFSDDNNDATVSSKLEYDLVRDESWQVAPFVEGSYSVANEDIRNGFPYWIADDRLVGGGGLALRIGNPTGHYFIDASASHFVENQGQPAFERYYAAMNFRIRKYFQLNASVDYYTIENFFSNGFNVGLRYDLGTFK